jgi:APA family basic amino acid/polyamine antiporter
VKNWIFFGLTVAGLFVLRSRLGEPAGYRTPGYPWLPASFVLAAIAVVISSILEAPARSAIGAGLLLTGVPAFFWFRSQHREAGAGTDRAKLTADSR